MGVLHQHPWSNNMLTQQKDKNKNNVILVLQNKFYNYAIQENL